MYTLSVEIPEFPFKIDHSHKLLLLGSCFSDEMNKGFQENGFITSANPFGTIFHPSVLARFIVETIEGNSTERIFQRDDVFLSWDAGAKLYGMSEKEFVSKLKEIRKDWNEQLQNADYLFVTFGSAVEYELDELKTSVANCHKIPATQFSKSISKQADLLIQWESVIEKLKEFNPKLKIIFTVSPVRHAKEGLIENNRSKAVLIGLVADLVKKEQCYYFSAYEIVLDELRDYRFFKEDLVHPNNLAISHVWDKLAAAFFTSQTTDLAKTYASIKQSENHVLMHPESKESNLFKAQLVKRKDAFLVQNPTLKF